jgi:hypothetical protein
MWRELGVDRYGGRGEKSCIAVLAVHDASSLVRHKPYQMPCSLFVIHVSPCRQTRRGEGGDNDENDGDNESHSDNDPPCYSCM